MTDNPAEPQDAPSSTASAADESSERVRQLRRSAFRVTVVNLALTTWVCWHNWPALTSQMRALLVAGILACAAVVVVVLRLLEGRLAAANVEQRRRIARTGARELMAVVLIPQGVVMSAAAIAAALSH